MKRTTLVLALGLVSFAACQRAGPRTSTYVSRDSMGIGIIESRSPAWRLGEEWRVDSTPVFDLSGEDDEELFRIGRPHRLANGELVLFNGGNCEVRFYGESGEGLGRVGRCGKGPGEFGEYASIWPWRADSIVVVQQRERVTFVARNGQIGRIERIPTANEMPIVYVEGTLDDGTFVLRGIPAPAGPEGLDVETSTNTLFLARGLSGALQIVGTYPAAVWEYTEFGGSIGRNQVAFSSATEFAVGGREIYVGFPDRYEIRVHSSDGVLKRIVRRSFNPTRVEKRDIDWLMERRLAQVPEAANRAIVRQAFRDLRHAEVMPAFGVPVWPGGSEGGPAMLVDADGDLWVFEYYRPGEYRNRWTVFSADGVWLGTVSLPDFLEPSEIGKSEVTGTWRDENTGFVHIRRYRIVKP